VGVLIDASVLVDHERGRLDLQGHLSRREDEPFFLSVITVSELLHGVHRADTPVRKAHRSVFVEAVIDRFPLLAVDLPTARIHADLGAQLSMSGHRIGAHDLWLAATSLAHGLSLATADIRDFGRVPGLSVEDWSIRRGE
jgi:tRNA(fMet)-specific endonuclease VapC